MAKTIAGRRIKTLEDALSDAAEYIRSDIRNVIECGTREYDLTTANKETAAAIAHSNELLDRLYTALTGGPAPAGVCIFCRCTEVQACVNEDEEPCSWFVSNVCSTPACVAAFKRDLQKRNGSNG
jgi:hypothetical protein